MYPLISVITPSYNNFATIYETINSVLSQSYPKIQYIISDDHSDDFRHDEIADYIFRKNKGNIVDLIIVQTDKNLGVAANLNFAISYAKGKYLFNVAADDVFYDDNVLYEWTEQFEATDAQVITAARAEYDETLTKQLAIAPLRHEKEQIINSSPSELFEIMSGCNFIFGCCTARTKRSFEKIGGYDERYPLMEDFPSNMKLLRLGEKITYWDRVVIKHRGGGASGYGKISDKYIKLSQKFFDKEILPYVKNRKSAKKKFFIWKLETKALPDANNYGIKLHKEKSVFNRMIYYFIIMLKHPLFAIYKIKIKIKNRTRYGH